MTRRPWSRSRVVVALALAAAVAGCRPDRTPRRVPDDGAPCSAVMPGPAESREAAIRLGAVAVTERSWELRPSDRGVEPATAATMYALRRGSVPAGAAL